jgi:hypothetical protein
MNTETEIDNGQKTLSKNHGELTIKTYILLGIAVWFSYITIFSILTTIDAGWCVSYFFRVYWRNVIALLWIGMSSISGFVFVGFGFVLLYAPIIFDRTRQPKTVVVWWFFLGLLGVSASPLVYRSLNYMQYRPSHIFMSVVDPLCSKVDLSYQEDGFLPGLRMDEGLPVKTILYPYGSSMLTKQIGKVQGFIRDPANNDLSYQHAFYLPISEGEVSAPRAVSAHRYGEQSVEPGHFAEYLGLNLEYFTTQRCRPSHIQYMAPVGGYGSKSFAYAIGAFGDGDGLRLGTGVAVLHIHNSALNQDLFVRYVRYRQARDAAQLQFAIEGVDTGIKPVDNAPYVWLPHPAVMTTDKQAKWDTMLDDLHQAGWR